MGPVSQPLKTIQPEKKEKKTLYFRKKVLKCLSTFSLKKKRKRRRHDSYSSIGVYFKRQS